MKRVIIGLIGILFCLCIYAIYFIATFKIFDDEFKVIKEIYLPHKKYSIYIYHIPSNASSEDYIQVRKVSNGVEEVLESFPRYNQLINCQIKQDTLILNIKDTIRLIENEKKVIIP